MYDILIIGSGPAGYVAAIRASQLGLKAACIEKKSVGGTCLNIGCIPSKSLLDSSLKYYQLGKDFSEHGIDLGSASIDLEKMMARKHSVVNQLTEGVTSLLKANKVELIHAQAKSIKKNSVEVIDEEGKKEIEAKHIIIATGSNPKNFPGIEIDNQIIFDSEGALEFSSIPKKLVVVGAGVIGLELGSIWSRLGSEVTILESEATFLPMLDGKLSRQIAREFKDQGLNINLGCHITEIQKKASGAEIKYTSKDTEEIISSDKVIIAIGREPNTTNLHFEDASILTDKDFIEVNEYCQTKLENVWAIGDVVRGPQLAHKATEEGIMVVERINGENPSLNYDHIPNVIYTHPEIAWVGKTEDQLKEENVDYKSGSFPFAASGKALAISEAVGSVNIVADKQTDKILGIQVFGPSASEILQQGLIAMGSDISSEDFSSIIVSHPTVSEALHEAVLAMNSKAIHIRNKKKT